MEATCSRPPWLTGSYHPRFDDPFAAEKALGLQIIKAVEDEDTERVEALIKDGADINVADPFGVTPCMKAAQHEHALPCLRALLAKSPDLEQANQQGRTALHIAAYWGNDIDPGGHPGGCLGLLIAAGAALDPLDGEGSSGDDLACGAF